MEKKNKSLVDEQDGEFVLNESGTSISIDPPQEEQIENYDELVPDHKPQEDTEELSGTDDV